MLAVCCTFASNQIHIWEFHHFTASNGCELHVIKTKTQPGCECWVFGVIKGDFNIVPQHIVPQQCLPSSSQTNSPASPSPHSFHLHRMQILLSLFQSLHLPRCSQFHQCSIFGQWITTRRQQHVSGPVLGSRMSNLDLTHTLLGEPMNQRLNRLLNTPSRLENNVKIKTMYSPWKHECPSLRMGLVPVVQTKQAPMTPSRQLPWGGLATPFNVPQPSIFCSHANLLCARAIDNLLIAQGYLQTSKLPWYFQPHVQRAVSRADASLTAVLDQMVGAPIL